MSVVWELDLSPGEKLVLLALADQANDEGRQCWPSVETICRRSGQGERTVRRILAGLEKKNLLTRHHRDGTSTQYHVHPCQIGTPVKTAPLPKTTETPAKLAPKPSRTTNKKNIAETDEPKAEKLACPESVQGSVWKDFIQYRKDKKAPLTPTAIKAIESEAVKAGWSLEAALAETMARGWQGFKADWVQAKAAPANDGGGNDYLRSMLAKQAPR